MNRFTFYTICLFMMVQHTLAVAGESRSILLNYAILSQGKDVGDVTTKISQQETRHIIIERSHIKASGWLWKIDIATVLSEEFINVNELTSADGKTFEEGAAHWTKISLQEDDFQMQYIKIPKTSPDEEEIFASLSTEAASAASLHSEQILSLSESVFSTSREVSEEVLISKRSFDTTWNNLPFYIQLIAERPIPETLNILDSENLEINRFSVKDIGKETMRIGTEQISARHLTFTTRKSNTSHIWINIEDNSIPYVVRHTGKDKDGAFEIVLKSIVLH